MQYIAAYALVSLSGKVPAAADVEAVLKAAGVAVDKTRLDLLITEVAGKSFEELVSTGSAKLASGAAPAKAATTTAAAPAAKAAAAPVEEEEDDMGMGGLF